MSGLIRDIHKPGECIQLSDTMKNVTPRMRSLSLAEELCFTLTGLHRRAVAEKHAPLLIRKRSSALPGVCDVLACRGTIARMRSPASCTSSLAAAQLWTPQLAERCTAMDMSAVPLLLLLRSSRTQYSAGVQLEERACQLRAHSLWQLPGAGGAAGGALRSCGSDSSVRCRISCR